MSNKLEDSSTVVETRWARGESSDRTYLDEQLAGGGPVGEQAGGELRARLLHKLPERRLQPAQVLLQLHRLHVNRLEVTPAPEQLLPDAE